MSDAPHAPPVPPTDDRDPIAEALRYRSLFYVGAAAAVFLFYGPLYSVAKATRGTLRPDLLTWGLFAFLLVEIPIFYFTMLDPARAPRRLVHSARKRGKQVRLTDHARTVCAVAVSFAVSPAAFGFMLLTMSGEAWRSLLFLPVSALAAAVLWKRIELVIRELARLVG